MTLLTWALIFAVITLVAGVFGFGGVASASAGIARILFFRMAQATPATGVGYGRLARPPRGGVGLGEALERQIDQFRPAKFRENPDSFEN